MEIGSVKQFFKGKTILVTGATGILGKIFVEKILRVQPEVKKIYLLLRASNHYSAEERMYDEIIGKELFKVLKANLGGNFGSFISEKITAISGDVSEENLGIKEENLRKEMMEEIDIILNSAATTKFDERFDVAMRTNTMGAFHVLNFAKNCSNLKILVHVSTAYVCGESEGLILEEPLRMGQTLKEFSELDIEYEKKLIKEKLNELKAEYANEGIITSKMRSFGIERANEHGWPNTYVFTKAMGEMLVGHMKENLPVVILRPTIITSTYKEPFPGWVEGARIIESLTVAFGKGKLKCFLGDIEAVVDVIPADMVINAIMVAMVANSNKPCDMIYHVGSSVRNPLRYIKFTEYGRRYFTEKPWIDKNGNPIKIGTFKVLDSVDSFQRYIFIYYLLPLKVLKLVNAICCQRFQKLYLELNRKIQRGLGLVGLYKPYLFFKGVFDDINTEKLRMAAMQGEVEMDLFYFDPKMIDWDDYAMTINIPSTVKYIFK
ncbi:hypothetical protein L6164_001290 [Bauhinia variegata]|uniref:Uncharacterized protein n=1 Tax=Bauhinia variegata TaxID=167791 RepID=A0ACB9QB72_BAUVA|nr:hypothetical protein L6164_001290 [Bauhinia variegata]